MTPALGLLAALALGQPWSAQDPSDPFQACALRALRGDFGELPPWKREAYLRGLERGVRVRGWAWRTSYYPWEGRQGRIDARGKPCTLRTAAANRLPLGTYVWIQTPCQMRQVLDRGSRYNDRVAKHKGADLWLDTWEPRPCENTVTRYAVIPGRETRT